MIKQTWKICTINVKGINEPEKFDDVIHWIETEDFDITILTETKLDPIKPFHNFNKKNKKYVGCWTYNCEHPKGTGVGIILKKSTVGKHIFKTEFQLGRIIQAQLKFKGKITITITGIYGPADHSDKTTKTAIIHAIHNSIHPKEKHFHILAGDLNEDNEHHTHTPILDMLAQVNLHNANSEMHYNTPTWSNNNGIERQLDHIYLSGELCSNGVHTSIENTNKYFDTDHKAVITTIGINQIISEQSNAKRTRRRKKNHKEEILDNTHNTEVHWALYKKHLTEEFQDPYITHPQCDINFAYNRIADQLGKIARFTLR
jgi:heat shock protein HspQ